jgi:hypothetical protein
VSHDTSQLFIQIGFTVLGGFVACGAGFWLSAHKRCRDAKDAFLVYISVMKGRIETQDVAAYYRRTKSEIRDSVSKVQPFLAKENTLALEILWREYDEIVPEQKLLQKNEGNQWERQALNELEPKNSPPPKPSSILKSYLDKFSALAK